jgi:hypothetical protein
MTDDGGVSFREKIATIGFVRGRPSPRKEYRTDDGVRVKEVTDDAGNVTTYQNTGDTERVGVEIRPQTVVQRMG